MVASEPFIRQISVNIGSQTEDRGGGGIASGLGLLSDGSRNGLSMSFRIQKTLQSAPNKGVVTIQNLARPTRERIRLSLALIKVNAGYRNTGLNLLGQGALETVFTDDNGTDYTTDLTFLDGYAGQTKGVSNKTFQRDIEISEVFRDLAGDMPGTSLGPIDIDGRLGSGGLTVSGRTTDELDALARQYGFTWSIQDGKVQAIDDRRAFNRNFEISASNRNLIKAGPIVDGPMQQNNGVSVLAIQDPRLRPGDTITLNSESNDQLNGTYKVHTIDFSGATFSDEWTMDIKAYKPRS